MKEFSDVTYVLTVILTLISTFGLILVIGAIVVGRMFRKIRFRIFLYTCLSILALQCSICLPTKYYEELCNVQAFLKSFSVVSCVVWSSVALYNIYAEIVFEKRMSECYYLAIGFVLPIFLNLSGVILGKYSTTNSWCPFNSDNSSQLLIAAEVFVPIFVSFFFNLTVCLRIKYFLERFEIGFRTEEYFEKLELFKTMRKLPICINFFMLFPMIVQYYYFKENADSLTVDLIGSLGEALLGYCATLCFASIFWTQAKRNSQISSLSSLNSDFPPSNS